MKANSNAFCIRGINRAASWLALKQQKNGSFGNSITDIVAYYKAPFALKTTGRDLEANRTLDYVKIHLMKENGDFGLNANKSFDEYMREYPAYPNGWLILAAYMLRRSDIFVKGLKYLMSFYNPDCGGFCTKEPYGKGDNTVDVITTSHLGLLSLYLGHTENAITAGELLITFVYIQPNKDLFYLRMNEQQKIITKFSKEKQKFFVIQSSQAEQDYFHLGYAIGFLIKLYLATRACRYLETAEEYASFLLKCKEDMYLFPVNRKVGWGFSLLSRVTKKEEYWNAASRILKEIIGEQKEKGEWAHSGGIYSLSDPTCFTYTLDLVSETIIWLNEIVRILPQHAY